MPPPEKLSDAKFRAARLLLNKKHRLKEGMCLIEGRRFVSEALEAGQAVDTVIVTEELAVREEGRDLLSRARSAGASVRTISPSRLAALSDTVTSQGVVAIARLPGVPISALPISGKGPALIVGLDRVSDPGNVGTIIRTGAWFAADGIILGEGTAELSNPKLLRSTMGAVFRVPVTAGADLAGAVRVMKREGFRIVIADAAGSEDGAVPGPGGKVFLIFGSEAHGIGPEIMGLADARYGIPRYGSGESLNVSVAVGIALARFRSQR